MILILEDATDEYVSSVSEAYKARNPEQPITVAGRLPYQLSELTDEPGTLHIVREYPYTSDVAEARYTDLLLASEGVRYWGTGLDSKWPTYAGPLPDIEDIESLFVDGEYSEGRTKYIRDFGVHYTGRTYSAPKCFIILDAKRKIDGHSPYDNPKVKNLLASLTEDYWGTAVLISSASVKRLEFLLEEHDQTIPITTSTGTAAKLRFGGFSFIETDLPSEISSKYGVALRSQTTLFERQ